MDPPTRISVSDLSQTLVSADTTSFTGIVTLIWPYSVSRHSIRVLLADPDFRRRTDRGQVLVHFHGAAANALAKANVQAGDSFTLNLDGAIFVDKDDSLNTPGKGVDFDLSYSSRLSVEILHCSDSSKTALNIEHAYESTPELPAVASIASPVPHPPPSNVEPIRTPARPVIERHGSQWSSPVFKQSAQTFSSSFGNRFDPSFKQFEAGRENKRLKITPFGPRWRYQATNSPDRDYLESPVARRVNDAIEDPSQSDSSQIVYTQAEPVHDGLHFERPLTLTAIEQDIALTQSSPVRHDTAFLTDTEIPKTVEDGQLEDMLKDDRLAGPSSFTTVISDSVGDNQPLLSYGPTESPSHIPETLLSHPAMIDAPPEPFFIPSRDSQAGHSPKSRLEPGVSDLASGLTTGFEPVGLKLDQLVGEATLEQSVAPEGSSGLGPRHHERSKPSIQSISSDSTLQPPHASFGDLLDASSHMQEQDFGTPTVPYFPTDLSGAANDPFESVISNYPDPEQEMEQRGPVSNHLFAPAGQMVFDPFVDYSSTHIIPQGLSQYPELSQAYDFDSAPQQGRQSSVSAPYETPESAIQLRGHSLETFDIAGDLTTTADNVADIVNQPFNEVPPLPPADASPKRSLLDIAQQVVGLRSSDDETGSSEVSENEDEELQTSAQPRTSIIGSAQTPIELLDSSDDEPESSVPPNVTRKFESLEPDESLPDSSVYESDSEASPRSDVDAEEDEAVSELEQAETATSLLQESDIPVSATSSISEKEVEAAAKSPSSIESGGQHEENADTRNQDSHTLPLVGIGESQLPNASVRSISRSPSVEEQDVDEKPNSTQLGSTAIIEPAKPKSLRLFPEYDDPITDLSTFTALKHLKSHFKQNVDILAIITDVQESKPKRATGGQRDFFVNFTIADPSNVAGVQVTILRPYKDAVPELRPGNGILLRDMLVTMVKGQMALNSTESAAWVVFDVSPEKIEDSISGPPVEFEDLEVEMIWVLWRWYQGEIPTRAAKEQSSFKSI